jgi:hypothetical protein
MEFFVRHAHLILGYKVEITDPNINGELLEEHICNNNFSFPHGFSLYSFSDHFDDFWKTRHFYVGIEIPNGRPGFISLKDQKAIIDSTDYYGVLEAVHSFRIPNTDIKLRALHREPSLFAVVDIY